VLSLPACLLARQVARLDQRVGAIGLQAASQELLFKYVQRLDVIGASNIPATGGVLLATNHPGMSDSIACFTSIPRRDVSIVAVDRPFLRALTNICNHLLFISDRQDERALIVRQVARRLREGQVVILNPAGQIEPDPAVMPGAIEALAAWSDSLGVFVRLSPGAVVVPMVVSGTIYGPTLSSPLTRVRRHPRDRERAAATIQAFLLTIGYLRSRQIVRVQFGPPLAAADLITLGSAEAITAAIRAATQAIMLEVVPARFRAPLAP
jgi:1-acyl-sn-glycerol-3-phosphate acyltransferase